MVERRMEELRILTNVSHELRTPLSCIQCVISNLLDGTVGELTKEQREYVNHPAPRAQGVKTPPQPKFQKASTAPRLSLSLAS